MKLKITIDMSNAAFDEPNTGTEVARILKSLAQDADRLTSVGDWFTLKDINGNNVGQAKVTR